MRCSALCFLALWAWTLTADSSAQDFTDVINDLAGQSSVLQQKQQELLNTREEIKREAEQLKAEEKSVEQMKAAAAASNDPGPLEGPFYLFTGKYSNDQSVKGRGESEAFGGPPQRGTEFSSLADAHQEAMDHMAGGGQASFRIEDSRGTILENSRGKRLSPSRIANPTAPKQDGGQVDAAVAAYNAKRAAFNARVEAYKAAKAAYDSDLAAYNQSVDRVGRELPQYLKALGPAAPTADELNAPKSDYPVENWASLSTGSSVGNGSSEALLEFAAKVPEPSKWLMGEIVKGANIRPGTPIATFKQDGTYTPGPGSHAAIVVTQNKNGLWVFDQYKNAAGQQRPVEKRFIRFKEGQGNPANDASAYSVIRKIPE